MQIGTSTVTAIFLGTTSIVSAYLGSTQVFGGASAFTPLDLFSGGAQGIWLDPSDLSTMFSDRAGTTPVTTPGTVVGLRLDKSKGLVLGSELVVNGDFSSTVTGWTIYGTATVTWDATNGGRAEINASAGFSGIQQNVTTQVGKYYTATVDVVDGTAVQYRLELGTMFVTSAANYSGSLTVGFRATSTSTVVRVHCTATAGTFYADNISVRELAGNHATAPTDAARPVYGIEPKGGRRNLLTYSEDFSQSIWSKAGVTASAPNVADPDGGTTAATITATTANGYFFYNTTSNPTSGTTLSVWIRRRNGTGTITLRTKASSATIDFPITVTTSWQRVSVACVAGTAVQNHWVLSIATSGDAIDIWHPQLELGSTATAYQKVTTDYDVTEAGVATCHYVQYDGSDDSMSTAAIDFTSTDKMSVFAGVRSLADHDGVIVETSAASWQNSGAFALGANSGGTGGFFTGLSGSLQGGFGIYAQAAPSSDLLAALFDIGAAARSDESRLRVDGTSVTQTFSNNNAGTGNFGNYPLYIGRRAGTSLPFNGRDYGIVIVGKAASAGEITDTELWLSDKTAQVTL